MRPGAVISNVHRDGENEAKHDADQAEGEEAEASPFTWAAHTRSKVLQMESLMNVAANHHATAGLPRLYRSSIVSPPILSCFRDRMSSQTELRPVIRNRFFDHPDPAIQRYLSCFMTAQ